MPKYNSVTQYYANMFGQNQYGTPNFAMRNPMNFTSQYNTGYTPQYSPQYSQEFNPYTANTSYMNNLQQKQSQAPWFMGTNSSQNYGTSNNFSMVNTQAASTYQPWNNLITQPNQQLLSSNNFSMINPQTTETYLPWNNLGVQANQQQMNPNNFAMTNTQNSSLSEAVNNIPTFNNTYTPYQNTVKDETVVKDEIMSTEKILKEIEEKQVIPQDNTKVVTDPIIPKDFVSTNTAEQITWGGITTGATISPIVGKYIKGKGPLSKKELIKYNQKYETGSKLLNSTKGVEANKLFTAYEIGGKQVDAVEWLKNIEKKNTHFKELNNGKGYTLDELKKLKNPPENVTKFLQQVNDAEKIQLNKRETFTPKDQQNLKALENRNAAYTKMENIKQSVTELETKLKTATGSEKNTLKKELKLKKTALGEADKEFAKVSKELEIAIKEQVKIAQSIEKQTVELSKSLTKATTDKAKTEILNQTLKEATKANNATMIETCKKLLATEPNKLLGACEGIATEAKAFSATASEAVKDISKFSKFKGLLGKAALPIAILFEGFDVVGAYNKSAKAGHKQVIKSTLGVAGGFAGAFAAAGAAAATGTAVGLAVGSVVPIAGNAVGAVAGFIVGAAAGAIGYWLGSKAGEVIADELIGEDDNEEESTENT